MNYKDARFYIILIYSKNYIEVAEYPLVRQHMNNIDASILEAVVSHVYLVIDNNFNTLSNLINLIISKNKKNYFIYSSIYECEQFLVRDSNIIPVYCIVGNYITKKITKHKITNNTVESLK